MSTGKVTPPLSALQERFVKSGLKDMSDQEILELLLNIHTPGKDYHKLASRIVARFNNLKKVLETPAEQVQQISGISNHDVSFLSTMGGVFRKLTVEWIMERPIYEPGREIYEYYHEITEARSQHFKMLCLDRAKRVTKELDLLTGKPDSGIAQSSRAVIEHAIKSGARYFVVAHNHLSGDPKPTKIDREITRDLVFTGLIIQTKLLDHVIIGKDSFYSFSADGLIDEYEMEYQDMKLRGTSEAKRRLKQARRNASID